LRGLRPADIPTLLPVQSIRLAESVVIAVSAPLASPALDACAIASALAPQRFFTASAIVVASALKRSQPILGSALGSQRFAARPWGSA
jgi:hypothetical protein